MDNGIHATNYLGDTSTWDNGFPSGGNYWSDYQTRYPNATEVGTSGIGDIPYIINENNQDNYPLMEPFVLPKFQSTMMSFDEAIDAVSLGKSNPCSGGFGMIGELEQAPFVDERGIIGFLAWLAPNGTIYQVEYPSERVLGKIGEYLDGYLPPPYGHIFWWLNYESGLQHLVDVSDGSIIWSRPIIIGPTSEPPPNGTSAIDNTILYDVTTSAVIAAVATATLLMIKRKKLKKN
ncbi:MAG: hypothetical protein JSW14_04915 [Candidatus Bathyarchaeum sp.]|nr:MAG: hypothetical protein JSW14_04915 [Candidatus Bathyarchaeum sp.]